MDCSSTCPLAVMLNTPGHTGHADPITIEDPDIVSYAMSLQPQSLSFTVGPEKTDDLIAFGRDLLDARSTSRME